MEQQFIDALYARDWYVVVALALFAMIFLAKQVPVLRERVWEQIPDAWRWLVPVLTGAATGFVDAFQEGLPWEQAIIRALAGAVFIGVTAMGLQSATKESTSITGQKERLKT